MTINRIKKKICVAIFSRANYGSIKKVLEELKKNKNIHLQILTGGSANIEKYGLTSKIIKKDNFKIDEEIYFFVDGDKPVTMVKTTALGMIETSTALQRLKPDIVLTIGDRYETMATVISASYMNIPIAHTMGGEVSGTIDESIRHAITKFSHIHFPATNKAKKNIISMGEDKKNVFQVGCPRIDLVKECLDKKIPDINLSVFNNGVGEKFDLNKKFITIMQYPVTTEFEKSQFQIEETLKAVSKINLPKLFFWPNPDAGTDKMSGTIRKWREQKKLKNTWFIKNLEHNLFFHILNKTECLIGNSSAAIREGSFIGVPSVSVGTRQNDRERGKNVINAKYDHNDIYNKIVFQLKSKKSKLKSNLYGNGNASKKISKILEKIQVKIQKKLNYK